MRKRDILEGNNALEGVFWSLSERLKTADELYRQFCLLTPYKRPKPFVKSFASFQEYETWKKRQKNPWLW